MAKLKILLNTPDLDKSGGVANYYKTLEGKFKNDVLYNFIGGSSSSRLGIFFFIADYFIFTYRILRFRPDIVHLNPSLDTKSVVRDSLFLLISRLFRRRVLVSWHGWKVVTEKKIERKFLLLFRFIFRKAHGFTVLNSEIKDKLISWKISVPVFFMTAMYDEALIGDFIIGEKVYGDNILFLSRVEKAKGIYKALDSFALLNNKESRFFIAGSGNELEQVRKYVRERNIFNVEFLGYVIDSAKRKAFRECSIYILLSESEGMPISMIEAMAFGLAVITTPVGGIKDFFEEGKMGFVTDAEEPGEISEKITILFNDPVKLKEISDYNHQYASEKFASRKVAEKLDDIYLEIAQNR